MSSATIGTIPSSAGPKSFWEKKGYAAHLEYFTKDGTKKKIDSFKRSMFVLFYSYLSAAMSKMTIGALFFSY